LANVSFGGTELSSLGFSLHSVQGRQAASWIAERARVLGRDIAVDVSGFFDPSTRTTLSGILSAPTTPPSSYTHANLLAARSSVIAACAPDEGYKKLVVTGDRATYWKWARYVEMSLTEQKLGPGSSLFRQPFAPLELAFDNLEPFWRRDVAIVSSAATNFAIANAGQKTRPIVTLTIGTTIDTTARTTLFTMDTGLTVYWTGTGTLQPQAGDKITIDSENLIVTITKSGTTTPREAVRAYGYSSASDDGFPIIAKGGSRVTSKHANISNISFDYDELTL
jgi:hypothetical protein